MINFAGRFGRFHNKHRRELRHAGKNSRFGDSDCLRGAAFVARRRVVAWRAERRVNQGPRVYTHRWLGIYRTMRQPVLKRKAGIMEIITIFEILLLLLKLVVAAGSSALA